MKAGVNSTAVLFGERMKEMSSLFAVIFVTFLCCAGVYNGQGALYFSVSVGGTILHCLWQLITLNPNDQKDCLNKFVVSE